MDGSQRTWSMNLRAQQWNTTHWIPHTAVLLLLLLGKADAPTCLHQQSDNRWRYGESELLIQKCYELCNTSWRRRGAMWSGLIPSLCVKYYITTSDGFSSHTATAQSVPLRQTARSITKCVHLWAIDVLFPSDRGRLAASPCFQTSC